MSKSAFCNTPLIIRVVGNARQETVDAKVRYSPGYDQLVETFTGRYPAIIAWWLPDDGKIAESVIRAHVDELNRLFNMYRETNAQTQKLFAEFESFYPTCIVRDPVAGTVPRRISDPGQRSQDIFPGKTEIRLVPRSLAMASDFFRVAPAFYHEASDAVHLHGRPIPPIVLASILYHEFGHWSAHRVRRASGQVLRDADAYDAEEIRMQEELEAPILDVVTNGAYSQLVNRVLAGRNGATLTPGGVLDLIIYDDFSALASMFALEGTDRLIVSGVITHFEYAVLFRYADAVSRDPLRTKILYYHAD